MDPRNPTPTDALDAVRSALLVAGVTHYSLAEAVDMLAAQRNVANGAMNVAEAHVDDAHRALQAAGIRAGEVDSFTKNADGESVTVGGRVLSLCDRIECLAAQRNEARFSMENAEADSVIPQRFKVTLPPRAKTALHDAADEIAKLCGCPEWEYPGQLVRDVHKLVDDLAKSQHAFVGVTNIYEKAEAERDDARHELTAVLCREKSPRQWVEAFGTCLHQWLKGKHYEQYTLGSTAANTLMHALGAEVIAVVKSRDQVLDEMVLEKRSRRDELTSLHAMLTDAGVPTVEMVAGRGGREFSIGDRVQLLVGDLNGSRNDLTDHREEYDASVEALTACGVAMHSGDDLALGIRALRDKLVPLEDHDVSAQLLVARETIARLNDRCHTYESALAEKIRTKPSGGSFARGMLGGMVAMYKQQLSEAVDVLRKLDDWFEGGHPVSNMSGNAYDVHALLERLDADTLASVNERRKIARMDKTIAENKARLLDELIESNNKTIAEQTHDDKIKSAEKALVDIAATVSETCTECWEPLTLCYDGWLKCTNEECKHFAIPWLTKAQSDAFVEAYAAESEVVGDVRVVPMAADAHEARRQRILHPLVGDELHDWSRYCPDCGAEYEGEGQVLRDDVWRRVPLGYACGRRHSLGHDGVVRLDAECQHKKRSDGVVDLPVGFGEVGDLGATKSVTLKPITKDVVDALKCAGSGVPEHLLSGAHSENAARSQYGIGCTFDQREFDASLEMVRFDRARRRTNVAIDAVVGLLLEENAIDRLDVSTISKRFTTRYIQSGTLGGPVVREEYVFDGEQFAVVDIDPGRGDEFCFTLGVKAGRLNGAATKALAEFDASDVKHDDHGAAALTDDEALALELLLENGNRFGDPLARAVMLLGGMFELDGLRKRGLVSGVDQAMPNLVTSTGRAALDAYKAKTPVVDSPEAEGVRGLRESLAELQDGGGHALRAAVEGMAEAVAEINKEG